MPPLYGFCLAMKAIEHQILSLVGTDNVGPVVHLSEANRRHGIAGAGDTLLASSRVLEVVPMAGRGTIATLGSEIRRSDELVIGTESRLLLAGITLDRYSACSGARKQERNSHRTKPSAAPALICAERTFASDQAQRYAEASGDQNAIHLDESAARAAGFDGVILHGMCVMAAAWSSAVQYIAGGDDARIGEISARFVRPVKPGERVKTEFRRLAGDGPDTSYLMEMRGENGVVIKGGVVEIAPSGEHKASC